MAKAQKEPVLLLQNSEPIVMMVSPQIWNQTIQRMRELERRETIRQRIARADREGDISYEEFMADLLPVVDDLQTE
ncbi:MAG: hypothetical protein AAF639_18290 [Chloroflexota bacterium]